MRLLKNFSVEVMVTKQNKPKNKPNQTNHLNHFKMKINKILNERIICVATHIRKRVAKLSQEVLDRPAFISAASEKQL